MCEFQGRNFFKGEENVKPEKNSIFLKKGKTIICRYITGGKSGNFLDMKKQTSPLNSSREI